MPHLIELIINKGSLQPTGAYGVTIADELQQRFQRTTSVTGVHVVLYRLEEKGLVSSALGGATLTQGGRRQRLFTLTAAGNVNP
ncbi:helix-turn-helix transcriptional regulator [Spirosoma telluris]|uniref:helix-turn-helix transcriptional regulator n=1 Tax=Spirosoma telluris TaxID=2183553 RepID=UPI002FC2BE77